MVPADKEKTSFTFGQGLWHFNVMLFGSCGGAGALDRRAPALIFQRGVGRRLSPAPNPLNLGYNSQAGVSGMTARWGLV